MDKISWTSGVKKRKHYKESRRRGTFYTKQNEGRLTRLVTSCTVTAFHNMVLKERYNRWEDEEEDVSIQWMT